MRPFVPALGVLLVTPLLAWSPARTTEAGLRLEIPDQEPWTAIDTPRPVPVRLANLGAEPIEGAVRIELTDSWRVVGDAVQAFRLEPDAETTLTFAVACGRDTYSVHYPIHAFARFRRNDQPHEAHAVLVVEAKLPAPGGAARPPDRAVTALRAPDAMRIDGLLDEWANAAAVALGAADASLGNPTIEDYSAQVFALWDAQALYLAVQAVDDRLDGADSSSRDLVDSDYVRVTLSRRPPGRVDRRLTPDDLVLALCPSGPQDRPQVKVASYGGDERTEFDTAAVTIAAAPTPGGWTLEAAIEWGALGMTAAADAEYGFNLLLGDSDGAGREAELSLGGTAGEYWTDPTMFVPLRLSALSRDPSGASLPTTRLTGRGAVPLFRLPPGRVVLSFFAGGQTVLPPGQTTDPESRGAWRAGEAVDRGERRVTIGFHPPYAGGRVGTIAADYRLALPDIRPILLDTGLAIRDHTAQEPPSDGVTFRVEVASEGGEFETVFERHTTAKRWEDHTVDLSAYAGRTVTLRLLGDPGPKRDTTCDSAYWGNALLRVGAKPVEETEAARAARTEKALTAAREARADRPGPGAWRLDSAAGTTGVALVPGPYGIADAALALSAEAGEVVFDGFQVEVAGMPLRDAALPGASARADGAALVIAQQASLEGREVALETRIVGRDGALTVAFAMPGVERDRRGQPRYTRLCLGPASSGSRRIYFGHGHVLVGCPRFTLGYGGFGLSTRFVGVDYDSGLSLVTATEPIPDSFEHDAARHFTSLVAHHDAVFCFVPSERGAFAAARVWRGIADLKPAPGVAAIRGKMCIDQWGGDYAEAARDLRLASAYGLDQAVFVKHVWQRWGYDYRLPDIYPPAGDRADFDAMVAAAKLNGRLFALHDNYIDFYPDADGFTYQHIAFTERGTPWPAWYNKGRDARSYRWLPQAFMPFLERNLKLIEANIDPSAYFIDVFSAAGPGDYYDRAGNFHPKTVCQEWWGRAFDRTREMIGGPTISEAGHDALIGHLDAAQADHLTAAPEPGDHLLRLSYEQWDRVPWYDMGHHGRFVLFAGGLGGRYQGDGPQKLHGYGSDDYLSLTILGGRTPMCDGPFFRRTVMTYYLLRPICAELETQEMLEHQFDGDQVRRQRVRWSDGEVIVNRSNSDWLVDGHVLPEYGFVARAGPHRADITRREGVITAFAQSPGLLFADARPPDEYHGFTPALTAEMGGFEDLGGRRFRLRLKLHVDEPVAPSYRLFVHLCGPADLLPGWTPNADILFQAGSGFQGAMLTEPGAHEIVIEGALPEQLRPGRVAVKYGFYDPEHGGGRLALRQPGYGDLRYDGGLLTIDGTGAQTTIGWTPGAMVVDSGRDNTARRVIDFGPVATNAAFRLQHTGQIWQLTLLPGSMAAVVTLDLARLGAAGRKITAIEQLDTSGAVVATVTPRVEGNRATFDTAPLAFAYRLRLD